MMVDLVKVNQIWERISKTGDTGDTTTGESSEDEENTLPIVA